jgi:hypothetical protein
LLYGFEPGFSGEMASFNVLTGETQSIGQSGLHVDTEIAFYDVPTVPAPAAVWLFGSGLLVLIGVARRKKA